MKQIEGYVRWYDLNSDDGIISDFEGNSWYFNSWSFALTHYRVTGKCKTTGREKTISTRMYPGLLLKQSVVKDFRCARIRYDQPVRFRQADGIDQRWAVDISFAPALKRQVLEYKLEGVLESFYSDSKFKFSDDYLNRRLEKLLLKIQEAA